MKGMKQVHLLIVTVAAAVVALIAIQSYWITKSISLKEDEFSRTVQDAMQATVEKLEQIETVNKLKSHSQGRYLFIDSDAEEKIQGTSSDTSFEYMIYKQISREGDEVEIKVTEQDENGTHTRTARRDAQDLQGADSINRLLEVNLQFADIEQDAYVTNDGGFNISEDLKNRLRMKKAFVGDIVKSLIEIDLYQPIEERIDPKRLDSIVQEELGIRGIRTTYGMAVADSKGMLPILTTPDWIDQLLASNYSTQLYPHDVIQDPYYLRLYFPRQTGYLLRTNWLMLASSAFIVIAIIFVFYATVRTIIHQKRTSEIKNDFINNMTHELKTPISTVSLACEALQDPDLASNKAVVSRYVNMINDENKRLGLLVEEVLQSAVLDKGDFKLKNEHLELNTLVKSVIDKFGIQVRERGGLVKTDYYPLQIPVTGDAVHLANVVSNLLDNANKYSKEQPEISVSTSVQNGQATVQVTDNGIGISKENQKRIFDKLYRVPTGNRHDVKGFGLGLSYVKIIIERLGGSVGLISQLGKGSTFIINLPVHEN
jgi:two-component system phosphate regulon sensor histidine kinase PhoR